MRENRLCKRLQKTLLVFMSCVCLSTFVHAEQKSNKTTDGGAAAPKQYFADVLYKGEYIPTALFYRNEKTEPWMRMSKSDNYREVVTCKPALIKLETVGQWMGYLKQDGSCGPEAEPATFKTGNRLNFDDSMVGQ